MGRDREGFWFLFPVGLEEKETETEEEMQMTIWDGVGGWYFWHM